MNDNIDRPSSGSGSKVRSSEKGIRTVYPDRGFPAVTGPVRESKSNQSEYGSPLAENVRSGEPYKAFFESPAFGAARLEFMTGRFLEVNETLCDMTGFTRNELLERTLFQLTHPEDLTQTLQMLEKQSKTSTCSRQIEKRLLRKDGQSIWVHVAKHVISTREGHPEYFAAVIIDISEVKRHEKQLVENLEVLRLSQKVGKVGTFDWDIRTSKVFWSDNCEDIFGAAPGSFDGTLEYWRKCVHPQDLPEVEAKREQALAQKARDFSVECRVTAYDGSIKWIESRTQLFYGEDGEFTRMFGINVDITQRKEAEEALQRSEAEAKARADELHAILDAVPTMTFIAHDPECRTMTSNRSAYEQLRLPQGTNASKSAPESQRPANFRTFKNGRELDPEDLPVQQAAATGQPMRNCELTLVFDDGTSRDIFGHAVPLLDPKGAVRGAVGAFIDITERKRVEELTIRDEIQTRLLGREILAREAVRERIARELHDESGQMLASLLAGLRAIGNSKNLKSVKKQVTTLRTLTKRTMDEVGRLARDLHPLVLNDLGLEIALRQLVAEYSKLHGIRVRLGISGLGPDRLASALELGLYRIVQEALTNVARHARAKAVDISIKVAAGQLSMSIVDNGCGFKLASTRADSRNHLGCQGMRERASMLGGQLQITSHPGGGTKVIAKVPVDGLSRILVDRPTS